jgi:spore photoproduct lyase
VMPLADWRSAYSRLLDDVAAALTDVPDVDLTVEIITHRFTAGSKDVLLEWYPKTRLEMDEDQRRPKRNKFGGTKYVYPTDTMREMRTWFVDALDRHLPGAQLLYWT